MRMAVTEVMERVVTATMNKLVYTTLASPGTLLTQRYTYHCQY